MNKKKLVIWSDFGVPSGFGQVAKNLFSELHNEYEVEIVGINCPPSYKFDSSKYHVYSTTVNDMHNKTTLFTVVERTKPDVIFLFQDLGQILKVIKKVKELSPNSRIVSYFPIDAPQLSKSFELVFKLSDTIITYTDYAKQVILDYFPEITKPINVLYHGVSSDYTPIGDSEVLKTIKKSNGLTNKFVVTNINRFQPRKAIPLTLRAFSMFAKGYKVCKCGNKYPISYKYCDLHHCSEEDVIETHNHDFKDVFLYLHMNNIEVSMGVEPTDSLSNHVLMAGFETKDNMRIIGINSKDLYDEKSYIPDTVINEIYNCSNVVISTTNGEGFGLSLIEATATGTTVIAPNNSMIKELADKTKNIILAKNIATYSHPYDGGVIRPIVDAFDITLKLLEEYDKWKEYKKCGKEKKLNVEACLISNIIFNWKHIREELASILKGS